MSLIEIYKYVYTTKILYTSVHSDLLIFVKKYNMPFHKNDLAKTKFRPKGPRHCISGILWARVESTFEAKTSLPILRKITKQRTHAAFFKFGVELGTEDMQI